MAYCDECGNNDSIIPNLYYYWDYPLEEDYDWRAARPSTIAFVRYALTF